MTVKFTMSAEARKRGLAAAAASLAAMTPEEDAAITADAEADPDARPFTDEEWAKARRVGRPPAENPKKLVSVRLDADVLATLRAGGSGWQTRLNALLRDSLGI